MPSAVSDFHDGEKAMHRALKVPQYENPTIPGLPGRYAMRVIQSPLMALGTLDSEGRPWTSIWGGQRGFAQPVAPGVLGIGSNVDREYDPVYEALWEGERGMVVQHGNGDDGKMMAALAIDLETRDRVKLMGRMMAGAVTEGGYGIQMAMLVTGSLGNCPKYLNKKTVVPHEPRPELVKDGLPLTQEAIDLLGRADVFFLSSTDGETMDTNHRGGAPGFVRVARNDDGRVVLVYPEYSGNRLYQTLGNFKVNPRVGVAVPDFETADVLHLTGTAAILVGAEASSLIARTQLAVEITVTSARFIRSSLPFTGRVVDYSPYNPPVRHLLSEKTSSLSQRGAPKGPDITATLQKREELTPTISRFTWRLSSASQGRIPLERWHAGQHITFDFDAEVGTGYAHMRDDDPQSLNDDYVRTFTISSPPPRTTLGLEKLDLQITVRKHGPVTGFLWRHNMRVPLEIPVLGLAGEEGFHIRKGVKEEQVFVAAGVGITPLLAQARDVLSTFTKLRVLWSLRGEDVPLANDSFSGIPGLAEATTLFVTAQHDNDGGLLKEARDMGATIKEKRLGQDDFKQWKGKSTRFYLCTGADMRRALEAWLDGEDVVWEDFSY